MLSPYCNTCIAVLMKKKENNVFSVPFQGIYESTRVDVIDSRYRFVVDAELRKDISKSCDDVQHVSGRLLVKELNKRLVARIKRLFGK